MVTDESSPPKESSRRQLLEQIGAVSAAGLLAGCNILDPGPQTPEENTTTPTPGEPTERVSTTGTDEQTDGPRGERYETVVDIVEQGADPNGGESIVPLLETHGGDDTLLYFPPGRYLMDDSWRPESFDNLGIQGEDATIVPPPGYSESPLFVLGTFGGARNLAVEGLHFDFTDPDTGPSPIFTLVNDGLLVRDISVAGSCRMTRFEVLEPDGEGYVENVRLPDGGFTGEFPPACYISASNHGTLTLKDFHVANFPNNGIYASGSQGPVRVVGGVFENNDISNVRVGSDSLVSDVTVRCVEPGDDSRNMRGIWVKGTGSTVEDCDVEIGRDPVSDGALVLNNSTTVRDSRFVVDADNVAAILGIDPERHGGEVAKEATTSVQRVDVRGDAAGGAAVKMINHDNCQFGGVSIDQTGEDRDAFEFFDVTDLVISDASVNVTGNRIVRHGSTVERMEF